MSIVIGKLTKKYFESSDGEYHVYRLRASGGSYYSAVYFGADAPKALKTIEYVLFGDLSDHPKYGKQLQITKYERSNLSSKEMANQASILSKSISLIGRSE